MLKKFWSHTRIGNTANFAADETESWESAGYRVDENGDPVSDPQRNTVTKFSVDDLDTDTFTDLALIRDTYAGDGDRVGDRVEFMQWLTGCGFDGDVIGKIIEYCSEELTEKCVYCDHDVPITSTSPPDGGDDAVWGELATAHDDDCEWVTTRAFNRPVPIN